MEHFTEKDRKELLEKLSKSENEWPACSRCGCKGLHACTGVPIIWTEEDKKRLTEALNKFMFKGKNE